MLGITLKKQAMAIFLLKAQAISRSSKGYTNMLDVASYRSEEEFEKKSFIQNIFKKKERCLASGINLPAEADESIRDRKTLWQKVEQSETRKNSRLAREFVLGLPKELNLKAHKKLVKKFTADLNRKGLICDWAIHKSTTNPHAHILTTTRKIEGDKFTTKQREWDKKEFLARAKNVWQGILNQELYKKKIEPVIQARKDPNKQSINLKPREYYLQKRLVKEWLTNPSSIAVRYNNKSQNYDVNILNEIPETKTKRAERKFRKYCIDIAEKEYPQEFNNFYLLLQQKEQEAKKKQKELDKKKKEKIQKKELETLREIKEIAKQEIIKKIKNNAITIVGNVIKYKDTIKDEKASKYLKNNFMQLVREVVKENPEYSQKYKIIETIKKLDRKQTIRR